MTVQQGQQVSNLIATARKSLWAAVDLMRGDDELTAARLTVTLIIVAQGTLYDAQHIALGEYSMPLTDKEAS